MFGFSVALGASTERVRPRARSRAMAQQRRVDQRLLLALVQPCDAGRRRGGRPRPAYSS